MNYFGGGGGGRLRIEGLVGGGGGGEASPLHPPVDETLIVQYFMGIVSLTS